MTEQRKTVLITGGSRGIGAATALVFARQGYQVAISYRRDKAAAESVLQAIKGAGGQGVALQADIGVESQICGLFQALDSTFGSLDVLVNNAGILQQQCSVLELDEARINQILRVNVTGTLLCCREAVKRMALSLGGRGGAIVNVSSMAAVKGSPNEYVDYAASKGAVDTMTRGLALEVAGDGIRVNGVRPGLIYTDMHASGGESGRVDRLAPVVPMGRGGQAGEIAEAIYWLASPNASFTTGAMLDTSGGL